MGHIDVSLSTILFSEQIQEDHINFQITASKHTYKHAHVHPHILANSYIYVITADSRSEKKFFKIGIVKNIFNNMNIIHLVLKQRYMHTLLS